MKPTLELEVQIKKRIKEIREYGIDLKDFLLIKTSYGELYISPLHPILNGKDDMPLLIDAVPVNNYTGNNESFKGESFHNCFNPIFENQL